MATYFPQFGGITTGRPYKTSDNYRTSKSKAHSGQEHTYAWRPLPYKKFEVNHPSMIDSDLTILEDFFDDMDGGLQEFRFLDPDGNLVQFSDAFSDATWTRANLTVGSTVTDPFGGTLARSIASTGSEGSMFASVLAAGGYTGFYVCASIWARATSANQQFRIRIQNGGPTTTYATQIVTLPQNTWRRVFVSAILDDDDIYVVYDGNGTWTGTTIQLFSAQVVPTPGPGPRVLTPGNYGFHQYCHFESDSIVKRHLGPNQTSVSVTIAEYNGA
jgi:hypothetical protein